ncbi:hypothetical protein AV926_18075 [Myroides marinus]|uniref:Uncharacterized protein n=1 Tax=Myroides marinus TaxID=703342 RepID=A0A165Q9K7_9FLAO|nr:hypothetical protein [Myroides marinus]KZE74144.1 hypothetical protein AV926_18075 [Myroides marinus]
MKTLSTNQIQHIEEFLISQYNIKYQDTRDEVLDHLACEVEELMSEGYGYEEAVKTVFLNWKELLKTDSYYFYKNTPHFISKNWIEQDSKIKSQSILIGIVVMTLQLTTLLHSDNAFLLISILLSTLTTSIAIILNQSINEILNEHSIYLKKKIQKVISFSAVINILTTCMFLFQSQLIAGDIYAFTQGFVVGGALFIPFSLTWILLTYKIYINQLKKLSL